MRNLGPNECRVVIDTLLFVPALAAAPDEARIYNLLLRKCCKLVVSPQIREQYFSVMERFGAPGGMVFIELSKLQVLNKLRECDESPEGVSEKLAPRKDRHIVAPCLNGYANYVISSDRGIVERRETIRQQTGARVLNLMEAEQEFSGKPDCPFDVAGER